MDRYQIPSSSLHNIDDRLMPLRVLDSVERVPAELPQPSMKIALFDHPPGSFGNISNQLDLPQSRVDNINDRFEPISISNLPNNMNHRSNHEFDNIDSKLKLMMNAFDPTSSALANIDYNSLDYYSHPI